MKEIYRDDQRTISVTETTIETTSARGQKIIPLSSTISDTIPADVQAALRKINEDPAGWYLVMCGKAPQVCLPETTRAAVAAALTEYRERIDAIRRDPAAIERSRIADLYRQARRYEDEDYGMMLNLTARANKALAAWKEQYPERAAAERAAKLDAEADHQDELASGALTYDADGWLDSTAQEARAKEFRVQAAEYRAEAARLRSR